MTLIKWEPRREFDSMQRSLRRMFEDFDQNFLVNMPSQQGSFMPHIDINEDKENLYFIAELPGLTDDDVKITVSDGVLSIRGEKKRSEEHKERNQYRIERVYGEFVRQFSLPDDVRADDIEAHFDNGLLEIVVPKAEPMKPKEKEVPILKSKTQGVHISPEGKLSNKTPEAVA